jgi:hypothetical protein
MFLIFQYRSVTFIVAV